MCIRDRFHYVSGRDEDVARACAGLQVIHEEGLGRSRTACVRGSLDTLRRSADGLDVDIIYLYLSGCCVLYALRIDFNTL